MANDQLVLYLGEGKNVHTYALVRRLAKSSKRSRSKGNSLPHTKWFDFTMVDDDLEELQCGLVPKETNADTKMRKALGPAQTQVLIDKEGVCLRCQVIMRC